MTLLRNILSDLVEKRLWPLALVLVAALFVAPSVLTKPATTEQSDADVLRPAPGSKAATAARTPVARVSLDTTVANGLGSHRMLGHDPFIQLFPSKIAAQGQLITPASGTTTGGPTAAPIDGTTPTTTTTTGSSKNTSKGHAKTPPPSTGGIVTLRFGESGSLKNLDHVEAYTPLPSQSEPFFVFLGLKPGDPKTAVFLISSDVKATGDGTCQPEITNCETVEMHASETEFFDLTTDSGTKQYQLVVVRISS